MRPIKLTSLRNTSIRWRFGWSELQSRMFLRAASHISQRMKGSDANRKARKVIEERPAPAVADMLLAVIRERP